jgi:hypothetical protein
MAKQTVQQSEEKLLRLDAARQLSWLPRRDDKPINFVTIWRWAQYGIHGIRLQHVVVGNSICTTETWLREFFQNVASVRATGARPPACVRTPSKREKDLAAAEAELAEAGI